MMQIELIQFNKQSVVEQVLFVRCYTNDGVFEVFTNHCDISYVLNSFIVFSKQEIYKGELKGVISVKHFIVKILAF